MYEEETLSKLKDGDESVSISDEEGNGEQTFAERLFNSS